MTEISVEANLREFVDNLYCSPDVLRYGGAMCFKKDGQLMLLTCREKCFNQPKYIVVVFSTPTGMNSNALVTTRDMFLSDGIRFAWFVDAIEPTIRQRWNWRIRCELDAFKTILGELSV